MQFIGINPLTTLSVLADQVGASNVDYILHLNNVPRVPQVGRAFAERCNAAIESTSEVTGAQKANILNTFTGDSDIFEKVALMNQPGWKLLKSVQNTIPEFLRVPDNIQIPKSVSVLGNGTAISPSIYDKAIRMLKEAPHVVDPVIFNKPSSVVSGFSTDLYRRASDGNPINWFRIPWGDITLYSSLTDESMDIPVYPEDLSDSRKANYTTMPDLLYQYEPWQVYQDSGPRIGTYKFTMHRDMWTGNHLDGNCNKLLRFCQAQCYPSYNGSAVYTSTVTLYVKGSVLISGVLTSCDIDWSGPIGQDGWYLAVDMTLSITEVAKQPLNYSSVRSMPLIG